MHTNRTSTSTSDQRRLDRLRTRARRHGMRVLKSRQRLHLDNRDGLMLVDAYRNAVIAGADYDLNLDQAEEWIENTIAG